MNCVCPAFVDTPLADTVTQFLDPDTLAWMDEMMEIPIRENRVLS